MAELAGEHPLEPGQLCLDAISDGRLEALLDSSGVLAFTFLLSIGAVLKESSNYPISDGCNSLRRIYQWHLRHFRSLLLSCSPLSSWPAFRR